MDKKGEKEVQSGILYRKYMYMESFDDNRLQI